MKDLITNLEKILQSQVAPPGSEEQTLAGITPIDAIVTDQVCVPWFIRFALVSYMSHTRKEYYVPL